MREIRIYQPGSYHAGEVIELSPQASHHVAVVLRMQIGHSLILFCGDDREFSAIIQQLTKKKVQVLIQDEKKVSKESPLAIHLAQAISKGERMEWVVQKAVELGVSSLTPLITERCAIKLNQEKLLKKIAQWQAIAISACEQCGRNTLLQIHPAIHLIDYLPGSALSTKFVLDPYQDRSWKAYDFTTCSALVLLIGPEGGLSQDEVTLAKKNDFQPLSLGPRILRTETAAISAISLLQAVAGDL